MNIYRFLTLSVLTAGALFGEAAWTPYVAEFTQVVKTTGTDGQTQVQQVSGKEERSANGSVLTMVQNNGTPTGGRFWDAKTGRVTEINFVSRKGLLVQVTPHNHSSTPPDAPVGAQVIAGLKCVGYPSHSGSPTGPVKGAVWVDEQDDIVMKTEMHDQVNGKEVHVTRTITNISLAEPDVEDMKVPTDIQVSEQKK